MNQTELFVIGCTHLETPLRTCGPLAISRLRPTFGCFWKRGKAKGNSVPLVHTNTLQRLLWVQPTDHQHPLQQHTAGSVHISLDALGQGQTQTDRQDINYHPEKTQSTAHPVAECCEKATPTAGCILCLAEHGQLITH